MVEDGSQAHGARHRGVRMGGFGDASGFSTNGVKPVATTEGGYMVTKEPDVYWKAIVSCQHAGRGDMIGRSNEPGSPEGLYPAVDTLVYTYRPNLVTALLTLDRLPKLDGENAARRANVESFRRQIAGVKAVSAPVADPDGECAFHIQTLNFDAEHAGISRDTYLKALQAEGVPAVTYVEKSLHKSPRLSPDWNGPRVMWTETIRQSGSDPTKVELPGCELKVARSIDLPWNYYREDKALMASIAAAFVKLEEGLDELRDWERSHSRSQPAGAH